MFSKIHERLNHLLYLLQYFPARRARYIVGLYTVGIVLQFTIFAYQNSEEEASEAESLVCKLSSCNLPAKEAERKFCERYFISEFDPNLSKRKSKFSPVKLKRLLIENRNLQGFPRKVNYRVIN